MLRPGQSVPVRLHWGKWKLKSIIRDHSAYVDALGNTVAQFDSKITIDLYAFNSVRSRNSYSQLSWVVHFLQNLLAWSVGGTDVASC